MKTRLYVLVIVSKSVENEATGKIEVHRNKVGELQFKSIHDALRVAKMTRLENFEIYSHPDLNSVWNKTGLSVYRTAEVLKWIRLKNQQTNAHETAVHKACVEINKLPVEPIFFKNQYIVLSAKRRVATEKEYSSYACNEFCIDVKFPTRQYHYGTYVTANWRTAPRQILRKRFAKDVYDIMYGYDTKTREKHLFDEKFIDRCASILEDAVERLDKLNAKLKKIVEITKVR